VEVRASGYSDPEGVWGKLPSGSCESLAQSLEAESLCREAPAPGEPEGGGGHRALERTEVAFPQKRALKEGRTIVFADEGWASTCCLWWFSHLRPGGEDAHPQGEPHARSPLKAMSGITLDEGKLYIIEQERAFKGEDALRFLKHLMRQIPGKLCSSYGRALRSIAEGRSRTFWRAGRPRGCNWSDYLATLRISTPTKGSGST
jgi:hypothetical protein